MRLIDAVTSAVVCVALTLACVAHAGAQPLPGLADPAWDAVFTRAQGWTGGDADYSVDLQDGRTLWLFADSWIGPVRDGKHAPGTRMINNALAVHPTPPRGKTPVIDSVRFFWGKPDDNGRPTSWITPAEPGTWYWPADAIVAPQPAGRPRLILTLWHMTRQDTGGGAFDFKSLGGAIALVDDTRGDPSTWRPRVAINPHTLGRDAAQARRMHEVNWGAAVIASPENPTRLYVYGVREEGWNKLLLLARAPAAEIERFDRWEFRTTDGWSRRLEDAAPQCSGVANEVRVQPVTHAGKRRWVLIHSEPMLGRRIFVRTAASPLGPWSPRQPVHQVELAGPGRFTYAAKSHPHLAADGELLLSYIVNTGDLWQTLADASVYRPRFVRVPVASIFAP